MSSSSVPPPPPKPNTGSSLPDTTASALPPFSTPLPLRTWQASQGIDPSHQIRLLRLSHVRYQHPDLDVITTFLQDFGMEPVTPPEPNDSVRYFRGTGGSGGEDPYVYYAEKGNEKKFLGGCFLVESKGELERAVERFGVSIRDLSSSEKEGGVAAAPGGGLMVTVRDPDGFPVNLIWGQEMRRGKKGEEGEGEKTTKKNEKIVLNYEKEKPRVRKFQRFTEGPAGVHKAGHFGISTKNFSAMMKWYLSNFNLAPSDLLHIPSPLDPSGNTLVDVTTFCHIDRGQDYVDHHSFFLGALPPDGPVASHVHHCSFEVHDFDTQHLGHYWLAKKGYKSVWGVGRHILGSQIFDYWWDPNGNMVEHYADGDLVNEDTPIGVGPAGPEGLAIWGPEVPRAFMG